MPNVSMYNLIRTKKVKVKKKSCHENCKSNLSESFLRGVHMYVYLQDVDINHPKTNMKMSRKRMNSTY